jgi:hypothetical protein
VPLRDAGAMNSGPTGSLTDSRRIRSISDLAPALSHQPATSRWLQSAGIARAPKRGSDALIEHPADRQLNNMFAETVLRQLIELLHGGKILGEPRGLRAAAETLSLAVLHHQPDPRNFANAPARELDEVIRRG